MKDGRSRGLQGLHQRRQEQQRNSESELRAEKEVPTETTTVSETHSIAAASNTVAASTQGAMFIAGFAYYEVGRFGGGNQDSPYLVLLVGALVNAILAAAVGGLFSCRLAVCESSSVNCGAAFARNGCWVVRATYRYYVLAVTLYLASLTRAGYQYYQPGAPRLVPTAFACVALAAFVHGYRIVIATFFASESLDVTDANKDKRTECLGCPRATYLHQQGRAISTVMIFVMSFTQAGVTRFAPSHPSMTPEYSEFAWLGMSWQAGLYLVSASLAFSCAAFAVFTSCVTLIFLYDIEGGPRKQHFATQIEQIWLAVQMASLVALLSFNVSFSTVGWGVGYASCRSIPTAISYFSLLVQCAVAFALLHAALTNPSTDDSENSNEDTRDLKEAVEAKLQTVALRSALSAGYVWYHLATFATDVGDYETLGVWYLGVHALAFGLGLTSCTVAHVTSICVANAHQDSQLKMVKTAQVIAQVVGVFYWLSLVCFILGFGLIGPVKKTTQVTVWLATLALVCLSLAVLCVRQRSQHQTSITEIDSSANSTENCTAQNDQLADQAFQSSGSFGYFCALFLNAPSAVGNEPSVLIALADRLGVDTATLSEQLPLLYCWMMGGSFVAALCLVALSTMLSVSGTQQGVRFDAFFRGLHWYAITSFQVGFILLGAQGQTVGYFALLCGFGSLVLLVSIVSRMILPRVLQPQVQTDQSGAVSSPRAALNWRRLRTSFVDRVSTEGSEVSVQLQFGAAVKQLQQLQQESCFVASNVFFELLFARAVTVDCWSHAIFLVGALLTFCLAACVHMASSTTLAFTAAHSALDSSTAAVRATRQVAVGAMVMMLCCMFCWMSSVGASAMVKYKLRSRCARALTYE